MTYVISDLNGKGFIGTLYQKEFQKRNKKVFKIQKEKKMNRKVDKPYDKQKAYDNSFNSQIDKKYIFR